MRRLMMVVAMMLFGCSLAVGGTIVASASGTIGGVELVNMGISGSTAMIEVDRVPNLFSFVNTVNGATIIPPDPVTVEGPIVLEVTKVSPEHYSLALVPPTYTEAIGPDASQAIMAFTMTAGVAPSSLPHFFNMSGRITSLIVNANPTYDYSRFAASGGINITLTGTTFGGGISSFDGLFTTLGSTIVANGSFSQAAVPAPPSLILAGIGIPMVLLFCWRFRQRDTSGRHPGGE